MKEWESGIHSEEGVQSGMPPVINPFLVQFFLMTLCRWKRHHVNEMSDIKHVDQIFKLNLFIFVDESCLHVKSRV